MEFIPQSVRWLVPEETSPCDIFLHFRGQYAIAVPAGEAFSLATLSKLAKAGYGHVYVKQANLAAWTAWTKSRHPSPAPATGPSPQAVEKAAAENKSLYGNKRAELQSYLQKVLTKKDDASEAFDDAFRGAMDALQRVMKSSMLDWYFQQFHEPPDLLYHNGRVAFSVALFCVAHKLAEGKDLENLIYSALIHELDGDPGRNLNTVVSQATLTTLEKSQRPVPQEVITLIRLHDELCSGLGFPSNKKLADIPVPVRAFTLLNHFEHYRMQNNGTRRARYERVKALMNARKQDYDPQLMGLMWDFWEKNVEHMG